MAGATGIWIVESDGQLIARCGASDSRGAVDLARLRSLIGETGPGAWALSDEAMATLLQRCESEAGAFDLPIGERRDAEVTVAIATDSMKAWIAVVPARGGLAPTIDSLVQTLARENVGHGPQTDALAQACAANAPIQIVVALGARKHELTDLIQQQNGDESKLGLLVKHLQSHGDPHGMRQRARDSWQQSLNALGDSLQELARLASRLGLAGHARVDVLSGVEGDVDLAIGAAGCHLRRSFGSGSFGLDANGGVEFMPTSGPAQAVG